MGSILLQVGLISLAKLPKEENQVQARSPGRTERNLKKFDVFIKNLQMGLNSMPIQNLSQINNMVCSGRWGNMFGQENLGLYALSSHVQWRNLGLYALGNLASMDSVGKSCWLRRIGAHLPHDTIFSQRIWAHFPLFLGCLEQSCFSHNFAHFPRATVFFETWPILASKHHVSMGPLQRDLIPLQWAQVASGNHVIPRKLGQLFLVGPLPFSFLFFIMKVIQEERLS